MSTPSAAAQRFRDDVLADPSFFPQKIDLYRQLILFLRMTREDYQQASFLDDRILTPRSEAQWAHFETVVAGLAGAQPAHPLHFIFHAGHVGSTLLSRLLEDAGGVLAIREPLTLRTLAEAHDFLSSAESLVSPAQFEALLRSQLVLWSRGYADTRAVIVKATSAAARLGSTLLTALPSARAVYLNLDLDSYLAVLLAGENSIIDLRGHGPERVRRLETLSASPVPPLYSLSAGELAALAWTTEKLTHLRLIETCGARVLSLDFNAMLADVGGALRHVCGHFGLTAAEAFFANAAQSPAMQRYAKAPEAPYSPQLRSQILDQSRAQHGEEILKGRRWAEALALRSPAVARALSTA